MGMLFNGFYPESDIPVAVRDRLLERIWSTDASDMDVDDKDLFASQIALNMGRESEDKELLDMLETWLGKPIARASVSIKGSISRRDFVALAVQTF